MKRKKAGMKQAKKVKKPSGWQISRAVHPGQIIQEHYLTPKKMTQADLTEKLGWKLTRLNKLINGKGGVTAGSAIDLAKATHTKPEYWLKLQLDYDLKRARAIRRGARWG